MIIEAKPIPAFIIRRGALFLTWLIRRRFNKMVIKGVEIKPAYSYLLMCNHFSFLDGFLAYYLCLHGINNKQEIKGIYMMSLKKQMEKNWWLKYIGAFSIAPGTRSIEESLNYAAEILNKPGNLLLMYPQGNLESNHVRHIEIKDGIAEIISRITGKCQLLWSTNLIEYFESLKPSVYFHMLDCETNKEFNFDILSEKINNHHKEAIQKQLRFTKEPSAY